MAFEEVFSKSYFHNSHFKRTKRTRNSNVPQNVVSQIFPSHLFFAAKLWEMWTMKIRWCTDVRGVAKHPRWLVLINCDALVVSVLAGTHYTMPFIWLSMDFYLITADHDICSLLAYFLRFSWIFQLLFWGINLKIFLHHKIVINVSGIHTVSHMYFAYLHLLTIFSNLTSIPL